jgi:ferrochelatase
MYRKTKVVIGQLGSPKTPKTKDVRSYLKEFLGDPRVVDINPLVWKIILNCFVLPFRPKKSGEAYGRIWDGEKFPLIENTRLFAHEVEKYVDEDIEVNYCFLLSEPRVEDLFQHWDGEDFDERADRVIVLPQFPQYSESTIASVYDTLGKSLGNRINIPNIEVVSQYHKLRAFIDLSAKKIQATLDQNQVDDLVISFHGIPLRRVLQKKDEYYLHCWETFVLIRDQLNFDKDKVHFCFQSRFGSEQWLGPATDEYAVELAKNGSKSIACYCPSFVVDCLETTDEIGNELREELEEENCHLHFIECLNYDEEWAREYAKFINTLANKGKAEIKELFYETDTKKMREEIPEQKQKSPPMDPKAKANVKLMFWTLFIDIIGFSIIFPMFPKLAKFYLENDSNNFFLQGIFRLLNALSSMGNIGSIVLFGGILGALYSLLQFFASPFWGSLSDRMGRRPVLLISLFGIFLSYVLWIFSGSFTLLLLSRVIGGLMAGNMSVASAVVADVTRPENRSKGMAYIGIAFALGFIFGPAIGGILSHFDLTESFPHWINLGINPFSVPAAFAAVLTLWNFLRVFKNYDETLDQNNRTKRSANILKLFAPRKVREVNLANLSYFFFITIFSGMEFTLTFLAVERLSYSPMDNAYMFIFIGVIIALVQGGYVRRKAQAMGERNMAGRGLLLIMPGLVLLGYAYSSWQLYLGLLFLSMGSAMAIPTLTSLVSLYSDKSEQGENLGIFRSLGALGRVFGPISAALIYWKYSSLAPYLIGAVALFIPIMILFKIPKHQTLNEN